MRNDPPLLPLYCARRGLLSLHEGRQFGQLGKGECASLAVLRGPRLRRMTPAVKSTCAHRRASASPSRQPGSDRKAARASNPMGKASRMVFPAACRCDRKIRTSCGYPGSQPNGTHSGRSTTHRRGTEFVSSRQGTIMSDRLRGTGTVGWLARGGRSVHARDPARSMRRGPAADRRAKPRIGDPGSPTDDRSTDGCARRGGRP